MPHFTREQAVNDPIVAREMKVCIEAIAPDRRRQHVAARTEVANKLRRAAEYAADVGLLCPTGPLAHPKETPEWRTFIDAHTQEWLTENALPEYCASLMKKLSDSPHVSHLELSDRAAQAVERFMRIAGLVARCIRLDVRPFERAHSAPEKALVTAG